MEHLRPPGKERMRPQGPKTTGRKTCSVCHKPQPLKAFAKDASRADGKLKRCRSCDSKRGKAWRKKNAERQRETARVWLAANPDKKLARDARYRAARPLLNRHKALLGYGLSLEWFTVQLEASGNACDRCREPFKNLGFGCHIDHDHLHCKGCRKKRGSCRNPDAVRGLLCPRCSCLLTIRWCKANPEDSYLVAYRKRLRAVRKVERTAAAVAVKREAGRQLLSALDDLDRTA